MNRRDVDARAREMSARGMSARGTKKARGRDGREVEDASTVRVPPPARTYAREEVRESDGCEGRANLVIVDGGVFDVTAWASEHPGGRTVLEQYAGRDITDAFAAYHGGDARVWARLEAMRAGALGRIPPRAETPWWLRRRSM